MPFVVVTHVKGRPGTTTTAVGLAGAIAPELCPVVIEADPTGGDLAARFRLPVSPGLVEFAARSRTGTDFGHLEPYVHRIWAADWDIGFVVAPPGGAKSRVALSLLLHEEADVPEPERLAFIDIGRYEVDSASSRWLDVAQIVILLVPGTIEGVAHVAEHLGDLKRRCGERLVLVVRGGPYDVGDVAAALDEDLPIHHLPDDSIAAAALSGDRATVRRWDRRPLPMALSKLAAVLAARLDVKALEEAPA